MATKATKATKAVVGFGVTPINGERSFGKTMTYNKMKLLSVVTTLIPMARTELGITKGQKLNWEYGGWSPEMVEMAHRVIDKYAAQLPPRQPKETRSGNYR